MKSKLTLLVFLFWVNYYGMAQNYIFPTVGLQNTVIGQCPVTLSSGNFFDNGGAGGNYSANINGTEITFNAATAGHCLKVSFTSFSMNDTYFLCFGPNSCCDYLQIFDGPNSSSPMLYNNCTVSPGTITGTSGSLTFKFVTDASVQLAGWAATFSTEPCSGGQASNSSSDCAYATPIYTSGALANATTGPGLVAEACADCSLGETYSHWYTFTIASSGTLGFTIDPNNNTTNFDFAVFPANATCGSLGNPIRCSNAAVSGNGNTGLGNGATDNSEDINGDQFTAQLNVTAGETYKILIDANRPNEAFNISFSGTATLLVFSPPTGTANATICYNTKALLTAACAIGTANWYDATGTSLQGTGSPFTTPNLIANTTYKVRCEGSNDYSSFVDVNVTVNPASTRIYVNANASGANNGSSWTDAFTSLQDALAAACSGAQIWVAAGTYKPDQGAGYTLGNRNHSFSMKNGVSILGGFPNDGTGTLANRNWATNPTILSGDLNGDDTFTGTGTNLVIGNNSDNSYLVISNGNTLDNTARLDGFIVSGANNNNSLFGGGVFNDGSSGTCNPVFANCVFRHNLASNGGAVANNGNNGTCNPSFTHCLFYQNQAIYNDISSYGGAMWCQGNVTTELNQCTFSQNKALGLSGAIYASNNAGSPNVTLHNCILWDNTAAFGGNQLSLSVCTLNLYYTLLQGGTAAIDNYNATINNNGGLLDANPLFVDVNGGNFRLQPCSPAVNAGDPATTSATVGNLDLAGNPRFYNSGRVDMGAYEYQGNALAQPTASASTTTPTICSGNTINLSASGGSSFSWTGPTGSNFSSTDQNPSFMGSSTSYSGLYSVSVSNANCPLTATATVSVQVNQGLNNPQVSPVAPLCAGASLLLSASGGTSYSWAGPTFSSALQNPARPAVTTAMAGTYSVTVSAGAGCFSVLTVSVQISPMVTAIQKGSNSPVCQSNTLQLSASGGVLYSWKAPDGFTSTEQNPARPSASAAMSGLYSVTVGNGGTCSLSTTLSVSVQAAALSVNPNTLTVCIGQTINLSANASPAASAFSWKGPGNFSSTSQNISTYATTTANLGIYSVSASIGSCTVSTTAEVKSGAVLQAGVVGIPCVGGTIQFTASGMTSYTWSRTTNNFNSNLPNPVIPSSTMNDAGIYFLSARSGSCVASALVPVMLAGSGINPSFSVNPSAIAAGATVALSAASASGSYSWSGPSGFSGNTRTKSISNFQAINNGVYRLTLTSGTCTGYTEKTISINSATRLAASENEPMEMEINAYPNPVTHTLTVEVRLKTPSSLQLNLVNSIGKDSGTWQLNEVTTFHKTELNLADLQGGVYLLQAQAGKQKAVKRVVKIQY